jgi:3-phenylpropionate/cinnamic acid dioxygenase small subunit
VPDARREIEALIYGYAERMDAGDLDGVGRLFDNARYGTGEGELPLSGAQVAEINKHLVILYEDGTPRTRHVTSNLILELDETAGVATSRSYFTVFQQAEDAPLAPIVAGRYHDRFEHADGAWRFSERRIFIDLMGDLSRHLRSVPKQMQSGS